MIHYVRTITSGLGSKQFQATTGVNFLDFGARLYDDRLCRWNTLDPMSEKYYGFSPYSYCAGDPVNRIDPEGKNPIVSALVGMAIDYGLRFMTTIRGVTQEKKHG